MSNGKKEWGWLWGAFMIALLLMAILVSLLSGGCNRGDLKISPVIEGEPAPHDGWNIGPDIWVTTGQPVKINGAVIWIKSVDPNSLIGSELRP